MTPDCRYACPRTREPLEYAEGGSRLKGKTLSFPVLQGIPRFLGLPACESPETVEGLVRLNRMCRERGWECALREVHGQSSDLFRYAMDVGRARFLDLLEAGRESVVLEIGSGLGQHTALAAKRFGFVYGLEVVAGQAEFAVERCRQNGAENVSIACGGDDCRLPYRDGSFDAVVCNLVLEWCASRGGEAPLSMQRRLVSEIARVTKPGGELYLSTKNRFGLRYLLGGRDEHLHGMRFGSALPRSLGRLWLRATGRPLVRARLHSYRSLRRLLLSAGFEAERSFWAAPEFRYPERYAETSPASIRAARKDPAFIQGETRLTRLVMPMIPASLVKFVTPGLTFVSRRRRHP